MRAYHVNGLLFDPQQALRTSEQTRHGMEYRTLTEDEALAAAFARAAGTCECIGGGCPSLSHRPGVNRCSAALNAIGTTAFLAASRFADRSDPENITAVCTACAEGPRRQSQRISAPPAG